jgi:hypothetical protein
LGPPTIAFAFATALLFAASSAVGASFVEPTTWMRWDGAIYASIASHGYQLYRCKAVPLWCGSGAWLPGYPGLVALLYAIGLHKAITGVIVSWLFDYAVLLLLWHVFLRRIDSPLRFVALVFAACIPGGVYMRTGFPMSMTVFFMLLSVILIRERRWLWAGVAAGIAGSCYPSANVMAPVLVVWVFTNEADRSRIRRTALACGSGLLAISGFIAFCLVLKLQTGHWNAFFLVEASYKHGLHLPTANLWPLIKDAVTLSQGWADAAGWQAILVAICCLTVTANAGIRALRRQATSWDALMVSLTLLLWLVPLTQRNESYWRTDTLLLVPLCLQLPKLRPRVAIPLTCAVIAVFVLVAAFYFNQTLM